MALAPGTKIDRYVVEAVLGTGAMGTVYQAHDPRLQRSVAIKLLEPHEGDTEGTVAAAFREAQAAAVLHHPHVAQIYDVSEEGDTAFIVMEHVRGASLRAFVGDPAIDVATRVRWLVDVAGALAAAHALGVIHRDVKPENVMVSEAGVIKVLDFGVARAPRRGAHADLRTLTEGGGVVGTPAYMAPEQVRGDPTDARADQFGWGVVAYELLGGALPWRPRGLGFGVLLAILSEDPAPFDAASGVPPDVGAAVLRALAKSPAARFDAMGDLVAALSPFAARSPWPHARAPDVATVPPPAATASAPREEPPSPPAPPSGDEGFRDPDFAAPVDLDAHLALLPPEATGKGMFFSGLLALAARARPGIDLFALAGVPARRYVSFRDYPMEEYMRLEVATALALHRNVPLGEGLRRLGWTALDALLGSLVGKTLFGVLGRDIELLLLAAPRGYQLTLSFGHLVTENTGPGRWLVHVIGMPAFLETYQVGVFEGGLRHCGVRGRVRVAMRGLGDATFEITLGDC